MNYACTTLQKLAQLGAKLRGEGKLTRRCSSRATYAELVFMVRGYVRR